MSDTKNKDKKMKNETKNQPKNQVVDKKVEKSLDDKVVDKKSKSSIHPGYRKIKVIMTDGEEFEVGSTYHGNTLKLDIDIKNHPAWRDGARVGPMKTGKVAEFTNKYGSMNFLSQKKPEVAPITPIIDPVVAKKEAKKEDGGAKPNDSEKK